MRLDELILELCEAIARHVREGNVEPQQACYKEISKIVPQTLDGVKLKIHAHKLVFNQGDYDLCFRVLNDCVAVMTARNR